MPNLLYPYLLSVMATLIVVGAALWSFVTTYLQRLRLPLATRLMDLAPRVENLRQEYEELKDRVNEARFTIEEASRLQARRDQLREELTTLEPEVAHLEKMRAELVQVGEELAAAREKRDQINDELQKAIFAQQQMAQKRQALAEQVAAMERQAEEARQRQAEQLATLEKQAEQIRQDVAGMRQKLDELEKEERAKRAALADLEAKVAGLERRNRELAQGVDQLARQREELKRAVHGLEHERKELQRTTSKLQAEKAALDVDVQAREKHLVKLREDLANREQEASGEKALEDLWQPVLAASELKKPQSPLSEMQALDRVRLYLRGLGLHFPDRAINAFHTSLKVSMETPLLVLAGISGTGKSLLPRRYAEALGMHFLPVPVQPRWDGPQDLLGFFNYLEGRYKATELTRALLQMDSFLKDVPDGYQSTRDRMLLVLLDEMNLARVEYYFSEFLSRLEMRRDMDRNSAADRAKAAIPLDLGRFERSGVSRSLFIDTNVLFVGTMNEDESTQSLSDKVIDRANVMRFGAPKQVQADSDGEAVAAPDRRAREYLPFDVWQQWIRKGQEQGVEEALRDYVERLNDALRYVGRPFGYRTGNAIRAYLQQYPDRSDQGLQNALADQIEQRVLPKLRGVDTNDDFGLRAVQEVASVARELKDEALVASIDRGLKAAGGHLFAWMGVEREDR